MPPILETRGLTFLERIRYPDLSVEAGEVVFLQGLSGSGKSSLLRLINATQEPSSGTIRYNGEDLAAWDPIALRREVILAGQSVWLFRGTVRENFAQFHQFRCSPPPADGEIERLLRLCAAPFTPRTSCDQLSGGERQRIFLAVALSFAPRLLLLDEPTSALDEATAQILLGNLTAWCRAGGMTLVAVSHDAGLAQRFSDRVVRIGAEQP